MQEERGLNKNTNYFNYCLLITIPSFTSYYIYIYIYIYTYTYMYINDVIVISESNAT